MKITELSDAILNTLRREKFVGNFEVTIHHPAMADAKFAGNMQDVVHNNGGSFSFTLRSKINEICFKIVSGDISDEGFTFVIEGRIEHVYEYKE